MIIFGKREALSSEAFQWNVKTILFAAKHNVYEQIVICKRLFADHVVYSRPMKREKKWSNDNKLCLLLR